MERNRRLFNQTCLTDPRTDKNQSDRGRPPHLVKNDGTVVPNPSEWPECIGDFVYDKFGSHSNAKLEERVKEFEEKFANSTVPRPPHWGGYVILPEYYEFWQGRKGRLHDRVIYQKDADGWAKIRLSP